MLRRLQRLGIYRGFSGSRSWLYVGVAAWAVRTLRRMGDPKPEILLSEELQPGERIIIANARSTTDDG